MVNAFLSRPDGTQETNLKPESDPAQTLRNTKENYRKQEEPAAQSGLRLPDDHVEELLVILLLVSHRQEQVSQTA